MEVPRDATEQQPNVNLVAIHPNLPISSTLPYTEEDGDDEYIYTYMLGNLTFVTPGPISPLSSTNTTSALCPFSPGSGRSFVLLQIPACLTFPAIQYLCN